MKKFTLTEDHIKLLRRANVNYSDFCEWGFVGLDCKRPFGNGDLIGDMARALGVRPVETDDDELHWPPGTRDRMLKIFKEELPTALEVVLSAGTFEPGEYLSADYTGQWRKADTFLHS